MRRLIVAILLLCGAVLAAGAAAPVRFVTVAPAVQLRVIDQGQGAAPPLVLIPGWSAGADIWQRQIATFAKTRRVIAFDPRSQGESSKPMVGNTPEQRAEDLHALLAALKVDRPMLVGWSQGVQDVAAYVARYGADALSGIVLVDGAVSDGAQAIAKRPAEAAAQFGRYPVYLGNQAAYLRGMFGFIISTPQASGVIDRLVATGLKTPPSIGLSMLIADLFGIDRTPALARMTCPVLIVAAASSGELERQRAEAGIIPRARFVTIDGAAHAVFVDQPTRFDAELAGFLATLS